MPIHFTVPGLCSLGGLGRIYGSLWQLPTSWLPVIRMITGFERGKKKVKQCRLPRSRSVPNMAHAGSLRLVTYQPDDI